MKNLKRYVLRLLLEPSVSVAVVAGSVFEARALAYARDRNASRAWLSPKTSNCEPDPA